MGPTINKDARARVSPDIRCPHGPHRCISCVACPDTDSDAIDADSRCTYIHVRVRTHVCGMYEPACAYADAKHARTRALRCTRVFRARMDELTDVIRTYVRTYG